MSDQLAALFKFISTGVYVVGVRNANDDHHAFTASWVMQASFDPMLIALSIGSSHHSYGMLQSGRVFSVNVLPANETGLAAHFAGATSRLDDVPWFAGQTGAPLLENAIAYFDCRLQDDYPCGDHRLVTGVVVDGAIRRPDGIPMLYQQTGDMDGSTPLYPDSF